MSWKNPSPVLEDILVVLIKAVCLCDRTIPVAERLFTSSVSVTLRQAVWYPSEAEEPHLVLLTSDNTIR